MPRHSPPPLPVEILARVLRSGARFARVILWLSAFFAVMAASAHEPLGAIAGCAAAGAGAIALHGVGLLRKGELAGLDWLIRAQLLLLGTILLYCAIRLLTVDSGEFASQMTPDIEAKLKELAVSREEFLNTVTLISQVWFTLVGFFSMLLLGARIRSLAHARAPVEQALQETVE